MGRRNFCDSESRAACCGCGAEPHAPGLGTSLRKAAWVVPSAVLLLMPKCPMCLAGYVAVLTGVGLSLAAATVLRWSVAGVCVCVLAFLATRTVVGWLGRGRGNAINSNIKEVDP